MDNVTGGGGGSADGSENGRSEEADPEDGDNDGRSITSILGTEFKVCPSRLVLCTPLT